MEAAAAAGGREGSGKGGRGRTWCLPVDDVERGGAVPDAVRSLDRPGNGTGDGRISWADKPFEIRKAGTRRAAEALIGLAATVTIGTDNSVGGSSAKAI